MIAILSDFLAEDICRCTQGSPPISGQSVIVELKPKSAQLKSIFLRALLLCRISTHFWVQNRSQKYLDHGSPKWGSFFDPKTRFKTLITELFVIKVLKRFLGSKNVPEIGTQNYTFLGPFLVPRMGPTSDKAVLASLSAYNNFKER